MLLLICRKIPSTRCPSCFELYPLSTYRFQHIQVPQGKVHVENMADNTHVLQTFFIFRFKCAGNNENVKSQKSVFYKIEKKSRNPYPEMHSTKMLIG